MVSIFINNYIFQNAVDVSMLANFIVNNDSVLYRRNNGWFPGRWNDHQRNLDDHLGTDSHNYI